MFKLSDNFIKQYEGKQPQWGFGDLSYFVYKRTYARLKEDGRQEEWWETCQRLIEGTFSIQKDYCDKFGLPWNARKAQNTAQDAYERMFTFKWLPPGRGLNNFSYDLIQKLGSSAFLNNCAYICTSSIDKDFGKPFAWACDALMNGVGVGFSALGAGKIKIQSPIVEKEVFIVPDSRDGWAESINLLLTSYTGNKKTVEFDYSQLRPAGAPLKTFGGSASGPKPLEDGHNDIRAILDKLNNKEITSTAIVDIMNIIGRFVVAGGTRRSAQLALGKIDDTSYIDMKNPEKYSEELTSHRWASNNSVIVQNEDSIQHTIANIIKNGEPGLFFIDNARHFGRMKDGFYPDEHDKCEAENVGVNPCIPDTVIILTPNGLKPFSSIKIGDIVWTGKSWAKLSNKWQTGIKSVFRYKTSSGYYIDCTSDHKLLTKTGKIKAESANDICISVPNRTPLIECDNYELALLAGLVQGDGSKQKNGGTCAYLNIGTKDKEFYSIPIIEQFVDRKIEANENRCEMWKLKFDFCHLNIEYAPLPERRISQYWMQAAPNLKQWFLRGLFSANGSVINGKRIALKTTSKVLANQVQLMLSSVGIKSYITTNKSKTVSFDNGDYICKESYDINTNQTNSFMEAIGFLQSYKEPLVKEQELAKEFTKIVDCDGLGEMPVWDFTIDAPEHTMWANGVIISNCSEQILEPTELCTLTELFPANHDSIEDFKKTLKVAYLYAKTVTLIPTHWKETNQIMIRNRRIGLSQSGIQQALRKFGPKQYFSEFCDKAYDYVTHLDRIYSRWLGVPNSFRRTSIKPSGTISLLAGATPGVHAAHSEYYFRTVRTTANDKLLEPLIKANYRIEVSNTDKKQLTKALKISGQDLKWHDGILLSELTPETWKAFQAEAGTVVVYFPIKENNFTKSKYDISLWEQLTLVKELQYYWSDNSVSVTVTFKPEEAKDLGYVIEYFRPYVKSLSFLPLDNHHYTQAPYITITKEEYDSATNGIKKLNLNKVTTQVQQERFCNNDSCTI